MPTNFLKIHRKEESMIRQVKIQNNSKEDFIKEVEVLAFQEVDSDFQEEGSDFQGEVLVFQVEVLDFLEEDFKVDFKEVNRVKGRGIEIQIEKVISNKEEHIVLVSGIKKQTINFDYQLIIFDTRYEYKYALYAQSAQYL
jgi:hypothetical protein